MNKPRVSIIAAMSAQTRAIGKDNGLLWHIPDDLKHFKKVTSGHPIIMGAKTFESIGFPLPGRTNIVLTLDKDWARDGVVLCHSLEEALEKANAIDSEEIFIIGGGQIYTLALPFADRLYLTLVDDKKEGDTYFPDYSSLHLTETARENRTHEGLDYSFVTLERIKN